MALVLPLLADMAANATFVAGLVLGARLVHYYYKFIKRGL